jgi:hypothetical protein
MGYTHYWDTKPTITKAKWDSFTKAVKILLKGVTVIQKEYTDSAKPVINSREVRFNGIEDDGHETFYMKRVDKPSAWSEDKTVVFNFCKTARKPYDKYATATLLLAHLYLGDEISIDSDGDVSDWQEGVNLINDKMSAIRFMITLSENPEAEYPQSVKTALFDWKELETA